MTRCEFTSAYQFCCLFEITGPKPRQSYRGDQEADDELQQGISCSEINSSGDSSNKVFTNRLGSVTTAVKYCCMFDIFIWDIKKSISTRKFEFVTVFKICFVE